MNLSITIFLLMSASSHLIPFIILMALWSMCLLKMGTISSHLFLTLLVLEFFTLLFFLFMVLLKWNFFVNSSTILLMFTLAVCEASLGLSLLIKVSRKSGSQMLSLL